MIPKCQATLNQKENPITHYTLLIYIDVYLIYYNNAVSAAICKHSHILGISKKSTLYI